ncbi:heme-binding protein [Streptomyces sp. JH14]|uniref:heme-binding protein n=1 Tax=Streptomyces sp. JH14 TaxID=2793630 RepID=UPI0023F7C992|nr:heme-binding protein [Streptomyces sp. JH14]MDF6046397.1 heme-binding protein [Streptomyces sp. JH14]
MCCAWSRGTRPTPWRAGRRAAGARRDVHRIGRGRRRATQYDQPRSPPAVRTRRSQRSVGVRRRLSATRRQGRCRGRIRTAAERSGPAGHEDREATYEGGETAGAHVRDTEGQVIGAVGVSGVNGEQDKAVGAAALTAFEAKVAGAASGRCLRLGHGPHVHEPLRP